ncbi:PREDICTED: uncharacterized protein LOC105571233 [Vollenhovia emeryi]|uniref:uncharacterized protein LOC105571233 n=1 Tax=Vollenhovia emeryi TaxID=411798 RepID=UPI0005F50273|nr:PREDICTED: uncharacterized protein LOC105571233 [Vollenhovia emeryi]
MAELKTLNKTRGTLKSRVTVFKRFLENTRSNNPDEAQALDDDTQEQVRERVSKIKGVLNEFEKVQAAIESLSDDAEANLLERESFETDYYEVTTGANQLLRRGVAQVQGRNQLEVGQKVSGQTDQAGPSPFSTRTEPILSPLFQSITSNPTGVRLPVIELPKFKGELSEWLKFRDTYKSLIHDNPNITSVQKFHYLQASLEGGAFETINEYEFSENNYEEAWRSLHDRYDNPKLLIQNHIDSIFKIKGLVGESAEQLLELLDSVTKHTRALKKLNEPIEHWDSLLIYIIVSKLDSVSAREWEKKKALVPEKAKLSDLTKCLRARALLLQTLRAKDDKEANKHKFKRGQQEKTKTFHAGKVTCALCKEGHHIQGCESFLKLDTQHRLEKLKALKLCTNCLRPGHFAKTCNFGSCKLCSAKHNTLLHFERGKANTDKNAAQEASIVASTMCSTGFNKPRVLGQLGPGVDGQCEVEISSKHSGYRFKVHCLIVAQITEDLMPSSAFSLESMGIPPHLKLADPSFNTPGRIDLLVGAEWFWDLLCVGQKKLENNLVMQKTKLGWVVGGPMAAPAPQRVECYLSKVASIEKQLIRFWELEEPSKEGALSREEEACEAHFKRNTKRDKSGRFIVKLPFKQEPSTLGDSRKRAEKRFLTLERKLLHNKALQEEYSAFLKEYEELGHMRRISDNEEPPHSYYLPHHCVIRSDSETTKLRVVFDASAATTNGVSLNDLQMTGPVIQSDLFSILVRFRKHTYVISADIAKMYRQVLVIPEQRPLQRILWREQPEQPIETFELNTVTYGTTAASFLAIRCLKQLAIECEQSNPNIAKIIKEDFYVDDLLTGGETLEEVVSIARGVSDVLAGGCFELRKWKANNHEFRAISKGANKPLAEVQLHKDGNKRTLGLVWRVENDILTYSVDLPRNNQVTKRSILSVTSMIFDPLGLLSPCTIMAKILIQKLWLEKLSWDESLPSSLHFQWTQYYNQLKLLNNFRIPRQAMAPNAAKVQIHGFADASKNAYGACVYVLVVDVESKIHTNLLCAKTKIAPLKTQTIPRLELCAALVLAKLISTVEGALEFWIGYAQPSRLPVFESNRVARIQELSKDRVWRHVPTEQNPADLLSRGTQPQELLNATLWWKGPAFLMSGSHSWPKRLAHKIDSTPVEFTFTATSSPTNIIEELLLRYSSLSKATRILAYCIQFISKLKPGGKENDVSVIQQRRSAITLMIKHVQSSSFRKEISMLNQGKFKYDKKHPVLLPGGHIFTKRLFSEEHILWLHASPQLLLASIRERFWPLRGRNLARKTVKSCTRCFRVNPKAMQPLMGHLPRDRVTAAFPFETTGIDYAGPFQIKDRKGRGCKVSKCYICLFVCFATKAMHLELVSDLTAEAFVATLRRFVSRRGKPSRIYSDNGKNFVGGNNALKELGKFLIEEAKVISELMADYEIEWNFIPAYSPHFGGLWEAGVKSVKHHLKRVAANALLTFEEFYTLLVQVEAVLNSRPLTPLSSNPDDLSPLTPAHFLIGRQFNSVVDPSLQHIKESRLSIWQRVQQIEQNLWERWNKECISEMQQRTKWRSPFPTLPRGTLVLIKEDNLPPAKWRLGRIEDTHAGSDGIARVASIRTSSGIVRRAFAKLCPLPLDEEKTV